MHIQFMEQRLEVVAHGVGADVKMCGDTADAMPVQQQLQHAPLASGEGVQFFGRKGLFEWIGLGRYRYPTVEGIRDNLDKIPGTAGLL